MLAAAVVIIDIDKVPLTEAEKREQSSFLSELVFMMAVALASHSDTNCWKPAWGKGSHCTWKVWEACWIKLHNQAGVQALCMYATLQSKLSSLACCLLKENT